MKFKAFVATMALPIVVAGCGLTTDYDLKELRATTPTGSAFTQALAKEYEAFAESERAQSDWSDAQYFARKGVVAVKGESPMPEDPATRDIDDKQALSELQSARTRLIKVLEAGAPTRSPALSATAQVKYDCWVEQQEEGFQTEHIDACKKDFLTAIDALEARQVVKPAPAPAADLNRFQVYFDFNKSDVTETAQRIAAEAVKAAKAGSVPHLTVVGHADRSGTDGYNQKLSLRRALAVKDALVKAGYPANAISVEARGEAEPVIPTDDGVRQPQNRRAVIQFR